MLEAPAGRLYGLSLKRRVPDDHLLRAIDRVVDRSDIRRHLAPFYSPIGRPSIDPELLIRMLTLATASASALSGCCARRPT